MTNLYLSDKDLINPVESVLSPTSLLFLLYIQLTAPIALAESDNSSIKGITFCL